MEGTQPRQGGRAVGKMAAEALTSETGRRQCLDARPAPTDAAAQKGQQFRYRLIDLKQFCARGEPILESYRLPGNVGTVTETGVEIPFTCWDGTPEASDPGLYVLRDILPKQPGRFGIFDTSVLHNVRALTISGDVDESIYEKHLVPESGYPKGTSSRLVVNDHRVRCADMTITAMTSDPLDRGGEDDPGGWYAQVGVFLDAKCRIGLVRTNDKLLIFNPAVSFHLRLVNVEISNWAD